MRMHLDDKEAPTMTAITLRNIPPQVQDAIRKRAGADGLSLNRAVIRMLEEVAGQRSSKPILHHDLDSLAGTWSDAEATAFEASLAEQRRVDPRFRKVPQIGAEVVVTPA
jgi:hypothetical protein